MTDTFELVEVNDKVWDVAHGWGEVICIYSESATFDVTFDFAYVTYNPYGEKVDETDNRTLFWDVIKYEAPKMPPRMKFKNVNGFKVPDVGFYPAKDEAYYVPDLLTRGLVGKFSHFDMGDSDQIHMSDSQLCYPLTDEGMEAAKAHAKAMLGQGERWK